MGNALGPVGRAGGQHNEKKVEVGGAYNAWLESTY